MHLPVANKDELVNTELSYSQVNTRMWRPYKVTVKIYNIIQRQTANDKIRKINNHFLSEKHTTVMKHCGEEALVASAEKMHRFLSIANYEVHIFCE